MSAPCARPILIAGTGRLDLEYLRALQEKPALFAPGEPLFWNDPHISGQMLAAHLDPHTDAASRRPETIARSVAWMVATLDLQPGDAVLDLGCGPGLYATRLAQCGLAVTGVDFSPTSIAWARRAAEQQQLAIAYRCQDYLELEDELRYDAALLIYGDYCPLAPEQRRRLLHNVRRALRPGGWFVLDVSTPQHRPRPDHYRHWDSAASGFWKDLPHLVLEQGFDYPEHAVSLDQYIVVEADGTVSVYRVWRQDFSRQTIAAELAQGGFAVQSLWGDLTGQPYTEETEWIGVVASKA